MKLNKKILVLAAVMLTAQSARAAVITRNDEGNIIISGNPGTEYAGTEVQIQILGPFDSNTGFSDAIFGDGGDTSVFMDATYANTVAVGEDGGYSFAYKISEENKFYTAAVLEPGAQTPQTASIYAASDELLYEFITQINQA